MVMLTKKLPMYLQQEKAECGYACIAMLAHYFGYEVKIGELRQRFGAYSQGMTLFQMRSVLSFLKLNSVALRVELKDLGALTFPIIIHWSLDHFVVLKKIRKNCFWLHDPAIGERVCQWDEMSRNYTGVVLTAEPTEQFETLRTQSVFKPFDLIRCVTGGKRILGLLLALSWLVECGHMIQALLMQYMTDSVIGMGGGYTIWTIAVGMLGVFTCFVVLEYVRGQVNLNFSTQLKTQFSVQAMRHLFKLPLHYFEQRAIGQLHLIFQSVEEIQRKFGTELIEGIIDGSLIVMNIGIMFYYSAALSSVVILGLAASLLIRYLTIDKLRSCRQLLLNYHGKTLSVFLETLQMMLPIKAYLKEIARWTQWRHRYVETTNIEMSLSMKELKYQSIIQFCLYFEYVILVCWGASLIESQYFSLGRLVAFLSFRMTLVTKANRLIQRLFNYYLIGVEWERVQDLLEQEPEIEASTVFRHETKSMRGHLRLEAVSYAYDKTFAPLLDKIDLEVSPGEKLAIVGASGSGKSTLLKIMMGLVPADLGKIYIDGEELYRYGLSSYRQQIASVLQDDKLMSGAISDNIVFFEDEIDRNWLEEVTRLAGIHEMITGLPMGYETRLSEMGSGLSGGERQRILLARALYKRPKLLFLDEASSHLDVQTERSVNGALKQLNITQVIVAHRQETIAMADRVIRLSGGKMNVN